MLDFVRILILILVLLLTVWARMPGLGVLFSLFTLINAYMENKRTEKLKKNIRPRSCAS